MRINYLIIKQGVFEKCFDFSDGNTLIYSKDNSVGKTTLLRTLLYSLGFRIPGTKLFPIEKCEYETEVVTDSGRVVKLMRNSIDYIVRMEGEDIETYCLPEQLDQLHAILFNTQDVNILDNILGAFYLDQEKGWTLLNRGVVIGSNHFNLEEFVQGLSGRDCGELKRQDALLLKELSKYEQISSVTKYKESLEKVDGSLLAEAPDDELDAQIELKQIELNYAKKELSRIDNVLKSNRQFKEYVNEMKLMVKTSKGEVIPVTTEKMSILEALASAGDLTIYGKRENILLIRESETGEKSVHRLNLNDANIINSPYYYLQQNDIVYVEPNKVKAKNSAIGSSTTIWFSFIGIVTSVASLLVNILR